MSILVENELEAVVNELPVASFRVTRVEKDELAVVKELPVASFLVTRVENDPLSVVNELPVASFFVTLVENEELAAVNEPLTPAAVNVLINEAFDPNEPLISLAICADELTTEPSASPSSLVILDAKLELKDVNEPLILTAS